MEKKLPVNLTIYDFFKTVAVILMLVDHFGYYFYPDELWFRVIGRLCVPIWFFLIGFANSRDLSAKLWIGGIILVIANIPTGQSILPLNILFTMIFVRLVLDHIMAHAVKGQNEFWAMNVMLILLAVPSFYVTEYGTQAIIMAMYGWLIRHRNDESLLPNMLLHHSAFALISFVVIQTLIFGFNDPQLMALQIGIFAVMGMLYFFKPAEFPALTKKLPAPVIFFFKLGGRKTLEIYVFHLVLFKALSIPLGRFEWFDWTWVMT